MAFHCLKRNFGIFNTTIFLIVGGLIFAACAEVKKENHRTLLGLGNSVSPLPSQSASRNFDVPTADPSASSSPSESSSPSPSSYVIVTSSSSATPTPMPSPSQAVDTQAPIPGENGHIFASNLTDSAVTLLWTGASDNKTFHTQLEYLVYQSTADNLSSIEEVESNGTPIGTFEADSDGKTILALNSCTTFYFNIVVKDRAGNKAIYTTVGATTLDVSAPVPGGAGVIVISDVASSSMTVSWSAATDNLTLPVNIEYLLYRSTLNNLNSISDVENLGTAIGTTTTNVFTKSVTGLVSARLYYYNVIVKDEVGNKGIYTPSSATTLDVVPPLPAASGAITLSSLSHTSFTINWTKATDNLNSPALLQYQVYKSSTNNIVAMNTVEQNGTPVGTYTTDINSMPITGLTPNTAYYFAVIVRDVAGNKGLYPMTFFTTLPPPPTLPTRDAYAKVNTAWTYPMTASNGSTPLTYSLVSAPTGATMNASTGVISFTPGASTGTESFTARVTDAVGRIATQTFTLFVNSEQNCVWTGAENIVFTNPNNWIFCSGGVPANNTNFAVIDSSAANQPTLQATAALAGFGPATSGGGGILTIAAGVDLGLSNDDGFRSDVTIKGATPTCTTCRIVVIGGASLYLINDSTLTLGSGISIVLGASQTLHVGSSTATGHLVAASGSPTATNWPVINALSVRVEGTAGHSSSVSIDGLTLAKGAIYFGANTSIEKFRNIDFNLGVVNGFSGASNVYLTCSSLVVNDLTWSGLNFVEGVRTNNVWNQMYAIDAGTCSAGFGPITISGTGRSFGLEDDPNNVLVWSTSTSKTCTWTGTAGTSWTNTSNWSNCSNGRHGYPDQLDWVIIPSGASNQPKVTGNQAMLGTAAGSGGGTITVNANSSLYISTLAADTLLSSIKFTGGSAGCVTCAVQFRSDVFLGDGVTLTLLANVQVTVSGRIYVGESTGRTGRASNFVTVGGATPANYPTLAPGGGQDGLIVVDGSTSTNSTVNIDGLVATQPVTYFCANPILDLKDRYTLTKLDNLTTSSDDGGRAFCRQESVRIDTCASPATLVTTWSNLTLDGNASISNNVAISAANCSSVSPITISGQGVLYGSSFANDPNGRLNWQ